MSRLPIPPGVVNVTPTQYEAVTGRASVGAIVRLANHTGLPLPGLRNVEAGGAVNAFPDTVAEVLESADMQSLTMEIGGRRILSWYKQTGVDPNPLDGRAVGTILADRVYLETSDGWLFCTWSANWYAIPFGETPQSRPCDAPGFVGCLKGHMVGLVIGELPGGMLWRPDPNPAINPNGVVLAPEDAPTPSNGGGEAVPPATTGEAPPKKVTLTDALVGGVIAYMLISD